MGGIGYVFLFLGLVLFQGSDGGQEDLKSRPSLPVSPDEGKVRATFYMLNHEEISLWDIEVKGPNPVTLEVQGSKESHLISLFHIQEMVRSKKRPNHFILKLVGEEVLEGRISGVSFSGVDAEEGSIPQTVKLRQVERIRFSSGELLKHCPNCEFEWKSAFWFCPECGSPMDLGEVPLEEEAEPRPQPTFRQRFLPR
jgi:hypothetical protein